MEQKIITHRGLEPAKKDYFAESSIEAFTDQLSRGYGLEFDLKVTKDRKIVIIHDSNLKRISEGTDERKIHEITLDEMLAMNFQGSHLTSFDRLLELVCEKQSPLAISAIHLKHDSQNEKDLDIILSYFKNLKEADYEKFIIFDVKLETAKYLKGKNSNLNLAPSVAHIHDIERYNSAVGGTLITIEEALSHPELFSWVWLDEWDLEDKTDGKKKLYTKEVFDKIHEAGMRVALVTPELHGTSPGLLSREAHPDAVDETSLFRRIEEIIKTNPDALCTDYPDRVRNLSKRQIPIINLEHE